VASVTRPDVRLIGYQRVDLSPGESRRVTFHFHMDLSSFTNRAGHRVVEPGALELRLGTSSADARHTARLTLTGPIRTPGPDRRLRCETEVS
jgi:beta-xylosidase